jgi:mannose-6-phosphate isomerase-like protein (cupin superfamily)
VTIDFGPGGGESVAAGAGDFFVVPSNTIHREATGREVDLEAVVLRVGGEPEEVGAEGPESTRG